MKIMKYVMIAGVTVETRTGTSRIILIIDNDQLDNNYFILQYVYYNPLHVSSIMCSSSGG